MFKSIIHGRERKILRKNGLMLSLEADHDREIEKKESKWEMWLHNDSKVEFSFEFFVVEGLIHSEE